MDQLIPSSSPAVMAYQAATLGGLLVSHGVYMVSTQQIVMLATIIFIEIKYSIVKQIVKKQLKEKNKCFRINFLNK